MSEVATRPKPRKRVKAETKGKRVPTRRARRKPPKAEERFVAAIRLRGTAGVPPDIETALDSLRLRKKFSAVLLPLRAETVGMLRRVKDYVTWGQIGKEGMKLLFQRRAKTPEGLGLTSKAVKAKFGVPNLDRLVSALLSGKLRLDALWKGGLRPRFALHPPKGGFKASTKRPFRDRGELGDRGTEIDRLIARMV